VNHERPDESPSAPALVAAWKVLPLLFGSGLCALVYQIAWLREFRLIFGSSTAASAATLSVFMGGIGAGALLLGARVDRNPRPLRYYALLEAGIGAYTILTPFLLDLVASAYRAAGGTMVLGPAAGTLLRLLLAALVLAVPTVLMGGTLPAAARAVESAGDPGRRRLGVLYGVNTLGAVSGCLLATFWVLERAGTRWTLWGACALNLLVAAAAFLLAARAAGAGPPSAVAALPPPQAVTAPPRFVMAAAAVVGFAFFLMELVWYRMLGPLLGGTVFTFGLILAVALLGIGIGGAWYSSWMRDRTPRLSAFALTCLLEAAALALPFALGDRLAILAALLRPLAAVGFAGQVAGWSVVAAIVVLPAAIVAGAQFPLLVALLGRGRHHVGRQVGQTYLWNTLGAIAGSLAGGFGLIPLLSAPGCWRLAAALLVALGLASAWVASGAGSPRRHRGLALAAGAGIVLALLAPGPTGAWRHSGVGAGRAKIGTSPNEVREWLNFGRRTVAWEADGLESSVAMTTTDSYALYINGKSDGSAMGDAPTQVMLGLLGAVLHPRPARALVVGLGTGSTAGWLAAVPEIERVDVVELERAVLHVARACAPVNHDAMDDPKVRVHIGDAREVLLTSRESYDLIVSEPSNPYRAGVASLFTREYYEAVDSRLAPQGIFVQWVQAYEVTVETLFTIYLTLGSVFPAVETWQVGKSDLAIVASRTPIAYDVPRLRARVAQEPYRGALIHAWRTTDLEGLLGRYVAGPALVEALRRSDVVPLNTDDRNPVEFAFARSVGRPDLAQIGRIRELAWQFGAGRPPAAGGDVDWERVDEERAVSIAIAGDIAPVDDSGLNPAQVQRFRAFLRFAAGKRLEALASWQRQSLQPSGPLELALVAEGQADAGDEAALAHIEALRAFQPVEADAILARLHLRRGAPKLAADALERALADYRSDPWPLPMLMRRALLLADEISFRAPPLAPRMSEALSRPFAVHVNEFSRYQVWIRVASRVQDPAHCVRVHESLEPHPIWLREELDARARCYRAAGHPLAARAERDLREFERHAVTIFEAVPGEDDDPGGSRP
jgi:predicted membrane-bound spermidine synthase